MPYPGLLHLEPLQQATADPYLHRRHSQFWLSLCGFGMHFVPFPGLSCSGDQVLGEHTVSGGLCVNHPHPWDSRGKNTGVGCHFLLQCVKVKSENEVAQSCPTLSDPMNCSLPGSSVHGIFQARVLEWVAIAFQLTML